VVVAVGAGAGGVGGGVVEQEQIGAALVQPVAVEVHIQ